MPASALTKISPIPKIPIVKGIRSNPLIMAVMPKLKRVIPVTGSKPMLAMRMPANPAPNPLIMEAPDRLTSVVRLKNKIPKYSGGPKLKAYFAIPGPMMEKAKTPSVPAMNEPTAAIHNASPARPCFVMGNPSKVVATEAASPGILTKILVVDPPYCDP